MTLRLQNFQGEELAPHLDDLGGLRIRIFREFPYLYDGTLEYEREYLSAYLNSPQSLVVLAFDGNCAVGATTCLPLRDEGSEFQEPFLKAGYDIDSVCYFGESILLPEYRGLGVGKEFFARREAHAKILPGLRWTAFCAVDRAADHPLRPPDYRSLDALWSKQGYRKQAELQATLVWKEIGEKIESPKTLTFWLKSWPAV